jgi:hypothetical protein
LCVLTLCPWVGFRLEKDFRKSLRKAAICLLMGEKVKIGRRSKYFTKYFTFLICKTHVRYRWHTAQLGFGKHFDRYSVMLAIPGKIDYFPILGTEINSKKMRGYKFVVKDLTTRLAALRRTDHLI